MCDDKDTSWRETLFRVLESELHSVSSDQTTDVQVSYQEVGGPATVIKSSVTDLHVVGRGDVQQRRFFAAASSECLGMGHDWCWVLCKLQRHTSDDSRSCPKTQCVLRSTLLILDAQSLEDMTGVVSDLVRTTSCSQHPVDSHCYFVRE